MTLTGIYNDRRSHLQVPMWVSGDAARVVRWIRAHARQQRSGAHMRLGPGQISRVEIIEVVLEGYPELVGKERGERVQAVISELLEANLLGEVGYFAYGLRPEIADVAVSVEPPLEVAGA